MKILLSLMLTLFIGCATNLNSKDYTIIQGALVTVPVVDGKSERLTFYVSTPGGVVIAIAENKENFELLRSLANQMGHNRATVYLFCRKADSEWREYVDSVDFEVFGVGYYDFYAKRYVTIITTYGNSFSDVMRSADWASFTSSLIKKGIGAAL